LSWICPDPLIVSDEARVIDAVPFRPSVQRTTKVVDAESFHAGMVPKQDMPSLAIRNSDVPVMRSIGVTVPRIDTVPLSVTATGTDAAQAASGQTPIRTAQLRSPFIARLWRFSAAIA